MEMKILATKSRKKVIVNIDHNMSQRIASLARTFFCGKKIKGAIDYRHSKKKNKQKNLHIFLWR